MTEPVQTTFSEKLDSLYYLKRDPFSLQDYRIEMAGREAEWHQILTRVEQAMHRSGNDIIVILGDYGMGKTYTLWQMHEHFKNFPELWVIEPIPLLSSESISRFAVDLVGRTLQRIGYTQVIDLIKEAGNTWQEYVDNPLVLDMLCDLTSDESKVRDRALDRLMKNRDNLIAQGVLFAFQFILAATGRQGFLWLIDEFEYIMVLSPAKVTQLINTIRDIYDRQAEFEMRYGLGKSAKIIFTFASSPAGWDRLTKLTQDAMRKTGGAGVAPFAQRILSTSMISLAPLDINGCHQLIARRLAKNRSRLAEGPLIPYDEDFAKFVFELTTGVPRKILEFTTVVLMGALEQDLPRITVDVARSILEKEGFLHKT